MFRPGAVRGAQPRGGTGRGQSNCRLARNSVVSEFQRGRLSRIDVCDAHPELLRAARNVGQQTHEDCPICEEAKVVLVSYAFGSGLPPSGRCICTPQELAKISRRAEIPCYVVEVCPDC